MALLRADWSLPASLQHDGAGSQGEETSARAFILPNAMSVCGRGSQPQTLLCFTTFSAAVAAATACPPAHVSTSKQEGSWRFAVVRGGNVSTILQFPNVASSGHGANPHLDSSLFP